MSDGKGIEFGEGVFVHPGSQIKAPKVVIGDFSRINGPAVIKGYAPVTIGRYCAIGDDLRIISSNHEMTHANLQAMLHSRFGFQPFAFERKPVVLENNVWIGDSAILLAGTHAGNGAVIGAGSVVTGEVPPFGIVAGVPAKLIGMRFSDEVIACLEEIAWWDWPAQRIERNRRFFEEDLAELSSSEIRALVVA